MCIICQSLTKYQRGNPFLILSMQFIVDGAQISGMLFRLDHIYMNEIAVAASYDNTIH